MDEGTEWIIRESHDGANRRTPAEARAAHMAHLEAMSRPRAGMGIPKPTGVGRPRPRLPRMLDDGTFIDAPAMPFIRPEKIRFLRPPDDLA